MSDTQQPNTEAIPEIKAEPKVSADDLRILYDSEKFKREAAEKKADDLSSRLAESELNLHNFKQQKAQEFTALERSARIAKEECDAAVKNTKAMEEKLKETLDASYQVYLAAWSESKIGKVTLPKDKTNTPELVAIALAAFDVGRGHLSARKEFQTALTAKLGL